jgi:hypothetical protein
MDNTVVDDDVVVVDTDAPVASGDGAEKVVAQAGDFGEGEAENMTDEQDNEDTEDTEDMTDAEGADTDGGADESASEARDDLSGDSAGGSDAGAKG